MTGVRLVGAHRVWADFAGIPAEVTSAFVATDKGGLVGCGYYASVEALAEIVDLSTLSPC
ncbi:hypothetical protein [Actinomadura rudentiformis]|uniref:Uncharacterized protein n=1 Tax=Actinomadura rudentiformis TaxID=359158 RepID=A0A6H9YJB2_9ACTN|nr:hypothetical protein [Actinomadura rudentiformis]KAB2344367.1 hypothetical protein F8566_30995 [Actinomadura rudentiformis]